MGVSKNFQCAECAAILREIRDAVPSDFQHVKESCLASGRDLGELRNEMLASFAQDDFAEPPLEHHPRTREARRRMAEHELGIPYSRTGCELLCPGRISDNLTEDIR